MNSLFGELGYVIIPTLIISSLLFWIIIWYNHKHINKLKNELK